MEEESPQNINEKQPQKGNRLRSTIIGVAVVFVLSLLPAAAFAGIWSGSVGKLMREPAPNFSENAGGTGCYLDNDAFRDIDSVTNADDVISKINDKDLKSNKAKENINEIIRRARLDENKINPAILIAIWGGEQGFSHPEKAFGCGVYDVDHDKDIDNLYPGFDAQLTCSIDKVKKAIANEAPYNKPAGVNIFTRLFYTYTGAMHKTYVEKGYVADASNSRIKFLNKLVPQDVVCESGSSLVGSTEDKPDRSFMINDIQKDWLTASNENGPRVKGKMPVSGIILHYTAGSSKEGAVSAMTNRGSFVQLIIDKDGKVYQLLPLNTRVANGSGDGNSFAIGIEIVGFESDLLKQYNPDKPLDQQGPQYQAVIKTVKYLTTAYNISNIKGNADNLDNHRGIFGHMQVQSKEGHNWEGLVKGCRTAKADPGKKYMEAVWKDIGATGTSCL